MNILRDFLEKRMRARTGTKMRIVRIRGVRRVRRAVRRRKTSKSSQAHYMEHKETTRALVAARLPAIIAGYAAIGIDFKPIGRIAIRNTRSRWGSCSSKGNLNFSYRLSLLPAHLSDYVIIHEVCHLREFNHSSRFWDLVALTAPDFDKHREELKKHSLRA